jgi:hypothetical protein
MPKDKFYGQHLVVTRTGYTHHGLGIGQNKVIHYSGLADGLESGPICIVTNDEFAGGKSIKIRVHTDRKYSNAFAIQRAKSRLGENAYSVYGNNCEHFVEWCITGDHSSPQVDRGVPIAAKVLTYGAAQGATAVVASTGAVAGLSASGVLSGLATVGGVVGGGAVAGLGVLGGAGGLGAAKLINETLLKDADHLPPSERDARGVGRKATYVGAAAATAGGIATVSAAGTVAGLSGAGIASGLAAIGGTVGGGMAAGTMIVAAAPVAAAAAVGYGVYKAWKWFQS